MSILRALTGFLCLAGLPLHAADPAPPPPPIWSGEGTLSYVQTGGNSDNKTFGSP